MSHLYNELGLSNIVSGTNDLEKKSKGDEEKNLLRHVDSVIETIMEETRLSEGEGELSKVLRSGKGAATSSQQGMLITCRNIEISLNFLYLNVLNLKRLTQTTQNNYRR